MCSIPFKASADTPGQLLQFVQTQDYAVERFVYHIECQPLLELLTRMIQTEGQFGTEGVVDVRPPFNFLSIVPL